jgi:hypothetical protein
MLNVQGLFAVMSVFSLVIFVPLGLIRFTIDLWHYRHASNPATAHLNYDGLVLAAHGFIISAICLLVFFLMESRFRSRLRKRN